MKFTTFLNESSDELDKLITDSFLDILHYGHYKDIPQNKKCEVWIGEKVVSINVNDYEFRGIKNKIKDQM